MSHIVLAGATFLTVGICAIFRGRLNFRFSWAHIAYVLFFLFFIISFLTSVTPDFGLSELLLFSSVGILLVVLCAVQVSEKQIERAGIFLIALAVADTLIGYFIYTRMAFPRMAGTFIDLAKPYVSTGNDFANFLLLIIPIAAWQFLKKHQRITTTILSGLSLAVLLAGFLLTFSRAAWISLFLVVVIGVAWVLFNSDKGAIKEHGFENKNRVLTRLGAALLVVIILTSCLQFVRSGSGFETTSLAKKLMFQSDEKAASASERAEYWNGAVKMIKTNPFFGTGIYSFKYLFPRAQQTFGINIEQPHNLFLKIGIENGIFAMIFFAVFIVGIAIYGARFLFKNPLHITLILALGSLAAFGHNLLDFNFVAGNFGLFAIFIGVILSFSLPHRPTEATETSHNDVPLRALFVVSGIFLFVALHEGFYNIDFKLGRQQLEQGKLEEAVTSLEKAGSLFFQRDRVNYLAQAYDKLYVDTKNQEWLNKEISLLNSVSAKTVDATLFAKVGELFMDQKSFKEAENWFAKALIFDSKNRFKYYYLLFLSQQEQQKDLDAGKKTQVLALLEEYKNILSKNQHFTVTTDNPKYASKLYALFGMTKDQEVIDKIWFDELIKFTGKYGAPAYQM